MLRAFSASGEKGPVASFRRGETGQGFEDTFALAVTERRDTKLKDPRALAFCDFMWLVWSGAADEEFIALCEKDMAQAVSSTGFL